MLIALPLAGCGAFKGNGGPKTPTVGQRVSIPITEVRAAATAATYTYTLVINDGVEGSEQTVARGNHHHRGGNNGGGPRERFACLFAVHTSCGASPN